MILGTVVPTSCGTIGKSNKNNLLAVERLNRQERSGNNETKDKKKDKGTKKERKKKASNSEVVILHHNRGGKCWNYVLFTRLIHSRLYYRRIRERKPKRMENKNKDYIKQHQKMAHNKKVFNDLYFLTKRQQEANGYRYSTKAVQYNEILR